MAMKPMKKAVAPKKKPSSARNPKETGTKSVNPYAASGTGFKHLTGAGSGRKVISRPKGIKVNGKIVPLPKNALQDGRSLPNVTIKSSKKKSVKEGPITSVGGYKSSKVLFNGAKKPKGAFTFPKGPKATFTGTTVASGSGVTKLNNAAKKMVAAQTAKRKAAAAAAAAKKKATPKKKTTAGTAPSGTFSIGGISLKK